MAYEYQLGGDPPIGWQIQADNKPATTKTY